MYIIVELQVSRSAHKSNGASEEQVCMCQFRVTWRHGPVTGKQATVRTENICLILDTPVDDPVLQNFIASARKSLEDRIGNLANQDVNSGLNPSASNLGASLHSAKDPVLVDVKSSNSSHNEVPFDIYIWNVLSLMCK
jgi:SAWADEE domain